MLMCLLWGIFWLSEIEHCAYNSYHLRSLACSHLFRYFFFFSDQEVNWEVHLTRVVQKSLGDQGTALKVPRMF